MNDPSLYPGILGLLALFALGAVLGYRYAYASRRVEAAVRYYERDFDRRVSDLDEELGGR